MLNSTVWSETITNPYAKVMVEANDCGLRMLLAMEFHSRGILSEWIANESIEAR